MLALSILSHTELISASHESIFWTVEWILPDGSRRLRCCAEDDFIEDAYNSLFKDKAASKSRKRKRTGKRKLLDGDDESQRTSNVHTEDTSPLDPHTVAGALESKPEISPSNDQVEESKKATQHASNVESTEQTNKGTLAANERRSAVYGIPQSASNNDMESKAAPNASADDNATKSETGHPSPHFYLHRPLSTSSSRILIPLSPSATLRYSLSNQTVLEFPTIHVLHEPPSALPPGMQLERDYLRHARQMVKELDEELNDFSGEGYNFADSEGAPPENDGVGFDESKVLETLKRDVAAVGRDVVE